MIAAAERLLGQANDLSALAEHYDEQTTIGTVDERFHAALDARACRMVALSLQLVAEALEREHE